MSARSGQRAKASEPLIIAAVALATFALGLIGFLSYSSPPTASGPHRYGLLDAIWATTTLFDGGGVGGADPAHLSVLLRVARVLAPLLLFYAAVRTVTAIFADHVRSARLSFLTGHFVVCGVTSRDQQLALALRADGSDVVLVGPGASLFGALSAAGVRIVDGECTEPAVLRRAGAARAALIATIGPDTALNAEVVEGAIDVCDDGRRASGQRRWRRFLGSQRQTQIVADITEPALAAVIRASLGSSEHPGCTVTLIDLDGISAHALVAEVDLNLELAEQVLVAGDDRLAQEVVHELARRWAVHRIDRRRVAEQMHSSDGAGDPPAKLNVTLAGARAGERVSRLLAAHPAIDQLLNLTGRDAGHQGSPVGEAWDELNTFAVRRAFLTGMNVSEGVGAGLALCQSMGSGEVVVAVARLLHGLEARLAEHTRKRDDHADLRVVSTGDEMLSLEVLRSGDQIERLARALNEERLLERAGWRPGSAEGLEPLATFAAQTARERAAARELAARLREAVMQDGYEIVDRDATEFTGADQPRLGFARELIGDLHPSRIVVALAKADLGLAPSSPAMQRDIVIGAIRAGDQPAAESAQLQALSDWSEVYASEVIAVAAAAGFETLVELNNVWSLAARTGGPQPPGSSPPVVIAGAAASLTAARTLQAEELLDRMLSLGRRRTLISGGSGQGIPGIVARVGARHGWPTIGYLPDGMRADPGYAELHRTPAGPYSLREPLAYWRDLLVGGTPASAVRLIAFPGGPLTRLEIALAVALGARVGLVRLAGADWDPPKPPATVELPVDSATLLAFADPVARHPEQRIRGRLAKEIHARYRTAHYELKSADDPAMAPWAELIEPLRESDRAQADAILRLLDRLGLSVTETDDDATAVRLDLDGDLERLAELEHGRWNVERLLAGWRPGLRDPAHKRTPYLIPYSELPDNVAEYDRDAIKAIPDVLAAAGLVAR
jgi:hypothetical protein